MQFGGFMWSIGSIEQRRMGTRVHPFVSGGVQQLATGIAFALPALLDGRHEEWNTKGLLAIAYLAVFGGIVGYSAFIYSMHHLPVALVSIYTYSIRLWRLRWAGGSIASHSAGAKQWQWW